MPNGSFKILKMSVDFATNHISGMSTAKATGLDGISVKLLKLWLHQQMFSLLLVSLTPL
jgi:hypothetical protein